MITKTPKLHHIFPITPELRLDIMAGMFGLDLEAEICQVMVAELKKKRNELGVSITDFHLTGVVMSAMKCNWHLAKQIEILIYHTTPELRKVALTSKTKASIRELVDGGLPADLALAINFYKKPESDV